MFLRHFHSPCLYKYSYNGQLQPVQMGHLDYQQLDLIKVKSSIKLEYVEINRGLFLVQFGWSNGDFWKEHYWSYSFQIPESKVTPHLCLPLNPLVLSEHCQGWSFEFIVESTLSVGKTVAPWILLLFFGVISKLLSRILKC